MSQPLLSLVVPVYNVAPYLLRCLESLVALTPPADEIIVVDDGSTDECPRILTEFAPRLPQMRVIRQENGGLSVARNAGLDAARGKYLAFVDSDDFVAPDAYAEALCLAEKDRLDMVLFNAEFHFEDREPDRPIIADRPSGDITAGAEWMRGRLRAGHLPHMVWMHLYRRDFIEENRFRFIPRLIHEDVIWTTRALLAARRVRYLDKVAVHYRIPQRRFSPEQNQRRLRAVADSTVVNLRTLAAIADGITDRELAELLRTQMVDGGLSVFHKLAKMPDRAAAAATLRRHRTEGDLALLWRHARSFAQRRRIARHWLRSWLGGIDK